MWIEPPNLPPLPRAKKGERRPRVSVVMPTFRRPTQVGATLKTVLAQRFEDFELLVRDDGDGKDGTAEAVASAAQGDSRVRYHHNSRNLRMPGNLNAGILETRGELVAICHDHDLFHPDFLAQLVSLLDAHPNALYAHCGLEVIGQDGQVQANHVGPWPELSSGAEWLSFLLSSFNSPVCALTLVRRSAHEQYGLYNPLCGFIADVELWIRLAQYGDVAYAARPLIQVMQRELDHEASRNPWPILAIQVAIQRHYAYRSLRGWQRLRKEAKLSWKADVTIAREVLYRLRKRQFEGFGDSASDLAAVSGPLGRVLAALGR